MRAFAKTALLTQLEGMSLTSISPSAGPATGGTTVTLTGTGFEPGVRVVFDGSDAVTQFVNSTTLVATTPPHAPATVWVAVFSADNRQNAWIDQAFHYRDVTPPQVFAFATGERERRMVPGQCLRVVRLDGRRESGDHRRPAATRSSCPPTRSGTTFTCSATSEGGTGSASITIKRDIDAAIDCHHVTARGAALRVGRRGDVRLHLQRQSVWRRAVRRRLAVGLADRHLDAGIAHLHGGRARRGRQPRLRTVEYAVSSDVCVAGLPTMGAWWRMEGNTRNTRSNSPDPRRRGSV